MNKLLVAAAALAVPVGFGFVCPALAKLDTPGATTGASVLLLVLGLGLMLGGAATVGYAIKDRRNGSVAS